MRSVARDDEGDGGVRTAGASLPTKQPAGAGGARSLGGFGGGGAAKSSSEDEGEADDGIDDDDIAEVRFARVVSAPLRSVPRSRWLSAHVKFGDMLRRASPRFVRGPRVVHGVRYPR